MSRQEQVEPWKKALESRDDCPDIERLAELVEQPEGPGAPTVGMHVQECPRCRAEMELLSRFKQEGPRASEAEDVDWMVRRLQAQSDAIFGDVPVTSRPTQNRTRMKGRSFLIRLFSSPGAAAALVAAGLLILIAGGLWMRQPNTIPLSAPGSTPDTLRSPQLSLLEPDGDLDRVPERFRWKALEGAIRYQVNVYEVDHSLLWKGSTSQDFLAVPESLRQLIVPGKRLLWQVNALDVRGQQMASSGLTAFRLKVTMPKRN